MIAMQNRQLVTFIQHADRSSVGSRAGKGTFGGISYTPVVVGGGDLKGRSPSNPSLCWLCNNHHTQERLCVLASDQAPAQESEAASRSTAATPSTTSASATTTISNGHSSSTVPDTVDPEFLSPQFAPVMVRDPSAVSSLSTASIHRRFDTQLDNVNNFNTVFSRIKQTSQDRQESLMRRTMV